MQRVVGLHPEPLRAGLVLIVHDLNAAVHLPAGPEHHLPARVPSLSPRALRTVIIAARPSHGKKSLQIAVGLIINEFETEIMINGLEQP